MRNDPCSGPGGCRAQGIAIGSGVGATVGGMVAVGCTVYTGSLCAITGSTLITLGATGGAAAGGLVGTVLDHRSELSSSGTEVVNSINSRVKEWFTALAILLGGGKPDIEIQQPPPPALEEPLRRPRRDGDPDDPPQENP